MPARDLHGSPCQGITVRSPLGVASSATSAPSVCTPHARPQPVMHMRRAGEEVPGTAVDQDPGGARVRAGLHLCEGGPTRDLQVREGLLKTVLLSGSSCWEADGVMLLCLEFEPSVTLHRARTPRVGETEARAATASCAAWTESLRHVSWLQDGAAGCHSGGQGGAAGPARGGQLCRPRALRRRARPAQCALTHLCAVPDTPFACGIGVTSVNASRGCAGYHLSGQHSA